MGLKTGLLWYIILYGRIISRREGYELSGSSGISGGSEETDPSVRGKMCIER